MLARVFSPIVRIWRSANRRRKKDPRAGVDEDRPNPMAGIGFARLAADFLNAAKLVVGEDEAGGVGRQVVLPHLFPFLFLVGHALELAYKAVLLVDGATERDLKRIGHDLMTCRRKVQGCCPDLLEDLEKPGTEAIVGMIGPYYKAKLLEYHKTGLYSGLPDDPHEVVTITAGTVKNIQEWVRSRVRHDRQTGGTGGVRDSRNRGMAILEGGPASPASLAAYR